MKRGNKTGNDRKELFGRIRETAHIDESFFEIDNENRIAKIEMRFEKASDIFDVNYLSKTPVLSDDFLDWIGSVFRLVSSKYKIDLTVRLDDTGGYSEEELSEIFRKNIELEFRNRLKETRQKNNVAIGLIATGVLFFIGMMLVNSLWESSSVWKDIFVYISDIATTVTFWEAATILIVEQKEKRAYLKDLESRFSGIRFVKANGFPKPAADRARSCWIEKI